MRSGHPDRRSQRPEVESLEALTFLSGLAATHSPAALVAPHFIPLPIIVGLKGTTQGYYAIKSLNPDAGRIYSLSTSGVFHDYGPGNVSGALRSVGFLAKGQATGTLLVNLQGGSVTLALTGPIQPGFSALPKTFSFTITHGTGKFHNFVGDPVGKGTVDVTLSAASKGAPAGVQGRIVLVFHSGIVAIA